MIASLPIAVLAIVIAFTAVANGAEILWRDNDDRPVAEPEKDEEANYLWWDGTWAMTYYQLWKILDLDTSLHTIGELLRLTGAREAANVNALDEVPDSTWFTNRHARRRLSAADLAHGPQRGKPPAESGPLTILSGKSAGITAGFDRRDLRALRVVAAWINFTDARRGNFYDSFVASEEGRGHLVHYVLDFSSALGSGNDDWKAPWHGQEYFFEPKQLVRFATLGLLRPAWENVSLTHPAIGYLDAEHFDPRSWRTTYPNPLFDHATVRDEFWGAKLVSSFRKEDLDVVARTGEWSDSQAAGVLAGILVGRQKKIATVAFDSRRINPIDRFEVAGDRLRFADLAVESDVASAEMARYRHRRPGGEWHEARDPIVAITSPEIELETSHDGGERWSPPTRVKFEPAGEGVDLVAIDRETR